MFRDIVDILRNGPVGPDTCLRAAIEIEALREKNTELWTELLRMKREVTLIFGIEEGDNA